jgi:hypothetical protein
LTAKQPAGEWRPLESLDLELTVLYGHVIVL